MIHPMWHEYAKIALAGYMGEEQGDDEYLDNADFKQWAANTASDCADIADAMCAEYDKRAMGQASAPTVSSETTERLATLRHGDGQ